jgi:hypothetical protein
MLLLALLDGDGFQQYGTQLRNQPRISRGEVNVEPGCGRQYLRRVTVLHAG